MKPQLAVQELGDNLFQLMVSSVKDYAIFLLDVNGYVSTWNQGAKRINGYEAHEIIGQHFSKFYLPSDLERDHPKEELKIAKAEGRYEEEGWRLRKNGSKFWANVLITRIDDSQGKHLGYAKVTRDLTERRDAEQKLRWHNENLEKRVEERTNQLKLALNARDEFLSIASHELKTPLTSLKLQVQMLIRKIETKNAFPTAKSLELSLKQINALNDLIEDLLDVSRIQIGRLELNIESTNLTQLVKEVVDRFAQQIALAGCTLDLKLTQEVIGRWDGHRLLQVLSNLISNAIKYAPKNPIVVSTSVDHEKATLIVKDFGQGIPKNHLHKIFERYERINPDSHVGGMGLGLFISRRIVEAHNGTIHVESEEGRGTQFTIELPLTFENLEA